MTLSIKHYFRLGNILILGLVVWLAVSLGMSVLGRRIESGLNTRGPVEVNHLAPQRSRSLSDYNDIVKYNIFGGSQSGVEIDDSAGPATPIVITGGEYRLIGTIIEDEKGYLAAILENTKTNEQDLYRPGDSLGSSELISVKPDSVIIRQGGREVTLPIYMSEGKSIVGRRSGSSRTISRNVNKASSGVLAREIGPNSYVIERENLARHMGDLSLFLSQVRIQPSFQNGQPNGFKIAAISTKSPIRQLGFRRGDVVLEVNDISVNNPEDLVNLYRQVQQLENVNVNLLRNGNPLTITYSLR